MGRWAIDRRVMLLAAGTLFASPGGWSFAAAQAPSSTGDMTTWTARFLAWREAVRAWRVPISALTRDNTAFMASLVSVGTAAVSGTGPEAGWVKAARARMDAMLDRARALTAAPLPQTPEPAAVGWASDREHLDSLSRDAVFLLQRVNAQSLSLDGLIATMPGARAGDEAARRLAALRVFELHWEMVAADLSEATADRVLSGYKPDDPGGYLDQARMMTAYAQRAFVAAAFALLDQGHDHRAQAQVEMQANIRRLDFAAGKLDEAVRGGLEQAGAKGDNATLALMESYRPASARERAISADLVVQAAFLTGPDSAAATPPRWLSVMTAIDPDLSRRHEADAQRTRLRAAVAPAAPDIPGKPPVIQMMPPPSAPPRS